MALPIKPKLEKTLPRDELAGFLRQLAAQAQSGALDFPGGAVPLARAMDAPVQSIFSGPAASVMGILATCTADADLLMLDIGGTTSDIALFAGGEPLLEREGIAIEGRPTLVRAIRVESIGIGGDSLIHLDGAEVKTGSQRLGPCMATGGSAPSLMDALNVLGLADFGQTQCSRDGLEALAAQHHLEVRALAQAAVDAALNAIAAKIEALVRMVNSKPVIKKLNGIRAT